MVLRLPRIICQHTRDNCYEEELGCMGNPPTYSPMSITNADTDFPNPPYLRIKIGKKQIKGK